MSGTQEGGGGLGNPEPGAPGPSRRPGASGVLLYVLAGALGLGVLGTAFCPGTLPEHEPAPDFQVTRLQGGEGLTLAALRGQVVVLGFWASWCAPCLEELPVLVRLVKALEPRGVTFLAVNQDDEEVARASVARFLERLPTLAPFVVFPEAAMAERYRIQVLPTLYVIGREGQILEAREGLVPEDVLRQALEKALAAPQGP